MKFQKLSIRDIATATTVKQVLKYGVVGVSNTLLTFFVYGAMTELFGYSKDLSNFVGYGVGLVNSFIWNKQWTFNHSSAWLGSAVRFLCSFAICFLLQRALFNYLNSHLSINHFYNFILAMVFYNIVFFLMNKYIIFKKQKA